MNSLYEKYYINSIVCISGVFKNFTQKMHIHELQKKTI